MFWILSTVSHDVGKRGKQYDKRRIFHVIDFDVNFITVEEGLPLCMKPTSQLRNSVARAQIVTSYSCNKVNVKVK